MASNTRSNKKRVRDEAEDRTESNKKAKGLAKTISSKKLQAVAGMSQQDFEAEETDWRSVMLKSEGKVAALEREHRKEASRYKKEAAEYRKEAADFKKEATENRKEAADLKKKIADLVTRVTDLEATVADLKVRVADLKVRVANLEATVASYTQYEIISPHKKRCF